MSLTAGNKSFPPQLRGWAPPNKDTTASALGRAVGAVASSPNPLNATKAAGQGLELYERETKALFLGQSGIVTFVNSVGSSGSAAGADITCVVDAVTGQLVGLQQAAVTACSTSGDAVVIPASSSYISQIKLAYTYDGTFVGRLIFDLKANATAKAVSYTCGSAGGKAVDLLPNNKDYIVTSVGVGCAPLPAVGGASGRRKLSAPPPPAVGLSAQRFTVAAAPLSSLPIDPATGLPRTPLLGDIIVATPVRAPPVVAQSTAALSVNSQYIQIAGQNFDASSPSANSVSFNLGAVGVVTAAASTLLTVFLSSRAVGLGSLTAVVTSGALSRYGSFFFKFLPMPLVARHSPFFFLFPFFFFLSLGGSQREPRNRRAGHGDAGDSDKRPLPGERPGERRPVRARRRRQPRQLRGHDRVEHVRATHGGGDPRFDGVRCRRGRQDRERRLCQPVRPRRLRRDHLVRRPSRRELAALQTLRDRDTEQHCLHPFEHRQCSHALHYLCCRIDHVLLGLASDEWPGLVRRKKDFFFFFKKEINFSVAARRSFLFFSRNSTHPTPAPDLNASSPPGT